MWERAREKTPRTEKEDYGDATVEEAEDPKRDEKKKRKKAAHRRARTPGLRRSQCVAEPYTQGTSGPRGTTAQKRAPL